MPLLLLFLIILMSLALRLGIAYLMALLFVFLTGTETIGGVDVYHIAIGLSLASIVFSTRVTKG